MQAKRKKNGSRFKAAEDPVLPFKQRQMTLFTKSPVLYAAKVICLLITALEFMQIASIGQFVTFPAASHRDWRDKGCEQMLRLQEENTGTLLRLPTCPPAGLRVKRQNAGAWRELERGGGPSRGTANTEECVCKSENQLPSQQLLLAARHSEERGAYVQSRSHCLSQAHTHSF